MDFDTYRTNLTELLRLKPQVERVLARYPEQCLWHFRAGDREGRARVS